MIRPTRRRPEHASALSRSPNEFLTGLIYINEEKPDFLTQLNMVEEPLATLPQKRVQPSPEDLQKIMQELM